MIINEVGISLPPDVDKQAEALAGFIASFFIKQIEEEWKSAKTNEDLVKYSEYFKLAKQYKDIGSKLFKVKTYHEVTDYGVSNFRISSKNEVLPHIILKISGGGNTSHHAYVDEGKTHAEIIFSADTYHFVKSFKKAVSDITTTLKHEIVHCIQLSTPSELNKFWGMPKDTVINKRADIFGHKDPKGYDAPLPHGLRDAEFKPNLPVYTHYIKDYLNRNHPSHEWKDVFKEIIMGKKQNTTSKMINYLSDQLETMLKRDNLRWKQFVKELSVMVFTK